MSTVRSQPVPVYITLISGSIAAIGSTFSKQPLDRLKWLRQVSEGESTITQSSYFRVLRSIVSTEGVFGLFRGVTAAVLRNIPHAALMYTAFPKVRRRISDSQIIQSPALINTISGATASIFVTGVTHPGDTMRVRYTVQFDTLRYRTYSDLFHAMRAEGLPSFYRGLLVSCVGTTIRGGVGFGVYESLKSDDIKKWHVAHPVIDRLGFGWMSGATSTLASYPADTLRRRMQVWGTHRALTSNEAAQFGSILPNHIRTARSLALHILQQEGIRGFFKGFLVTMIKTPIATSVSLTLNDVVKKYMFGIDA